jgi:outer membrane immunogenic protein
MWSGFYVGLNAGGTWANSSGQYIGVRPFTADNGWILGGVPGAWTQNRAAFSSAASASGVNNGNNGGFIGGGQIGFNALLFKAFVVGAETDIQGVANNSGSRAFVTAAPTGFGDSWTSNQSVRGNLQYIGTVRTRLGWLATPTLLLYGTYGFAYGGVNLNTASYVYKLNSVGNIDTNINPSFGGVNASNTQTGWTAGGGIEWIFMPNWSAKAEYLYYDLGTVTKYYTLISNNAVNNNSAVFGGQASARLTGNIVRAGVNYHFNLGSSAPVVANY